MANELKGKRVAFLAAEMFEQGVEVLFGGR